MRISPKYKVDDWMKASKLEDWQTMIAIFKDRIHGRFIVPICMIEHYEFAGFTVMALDCLLIETLQQFYRGVNETPNRQSGPYFTDFLTKTSFSKWFKTKEMAKMFFDHIRCGILHQAETKEDSLITIKKDAPLIEHTVNRKSLVINRKLFHKQLVKEVESYITKLRNPKEQELRQNFINKMNHICRSS